MTKINDAFQFMNKNVAEMDESEAAFYTMEARNAAATIIRTHRTKASDFFVLLATHLAEHAKTLQAKEAPNASND